MSHKIAYMKDRFEAFTRRVSDELNTAGMERNPMTWKRVDDGFVVWVAVLTDRKPAFSLAFRPEGESLEIPGYLSMPYKPAMFRPLMMLAKGEYTHSEARIRCVEILHNEDCAFAGSGRPSPFKNIGDVPSPYYEVIHKLLRLAQLPEFEDPPSRFIDSNNFRITLKKLSSKMDRLLNKYEPKEEHHMSTSQRSDSSRPNYSNVPKGPGNIHNVCRRCHCIIPQGQDCSCSKAPLFKFHLETLKGIDPEATLSANRRMAYLPSVKAQVYDDGAILLHGEYTGPGAYDLARRVIEDHRMHPVYRQFLDSCQEGDFYTFHGRHFEENHKADENLLELHVVSLNACFIIQKGGQEIDARHIGDAKSDNTLVGAIADFAIYLTRKIDGIIEFQKESWD